MIRDLFIQELERHGGNVELAERLLLQGYNPFVTWLTFELCVHKDGTPIMETLGAFADLTGMPLHKIRNSYYRASVNTIVDVRRAETFERVRRVVETVYPHPTLWDNLLRYAYGAVRRLAVEILVEQDVNSADIEDKLNVSQSLVYKIRKEYLTRFIQQKGDYADDTERY